MHRFTRLLSSAGAMAIALVVSTAVAGKAAMTAALGAFDEAWSHVNDYTVNVKAHEVQGSSSQDRVYQYWFRKPHQAKTLITSGDGRGSGGVWNGGDTVSGHQGGFLSGIHLTVSIHDGRATSIRGYTIPDGLLQNQVGQYENTKGELSQKDGANNTTEVDLKVASPESSGPNSGVTKMAIWFSNATHMPVRQVRWAGDAVVTDETWNDLKTNVGLTDKDF
ncbi:MAG: hypothetical protein JOZ38_06330 [Candidatus Eremiobacteraeota bacterium]|nr:hypothetical protein [Candidatus Eremiobacteraeota bacterium]